MGEISEDELTSGEREFLVIVQQLKRGDLRRLMAQARALIDYKDGY
jgi:hypothetical protein